ncbi:hypothetical protein V1509DRAFT_260210 [Lipomyces kononenkoae]
MAQCLDDQVGRCLFCYSTTQWIVFCQVVSFNVCSLTSISDKIRLRSGLMQPSLAYYLPVGVIQINLRLGLGLLMLA